MMVRITINNKQVEVPEGTSVMAAAQHFGVDVPNMCWNGELEHFTSCMLCMVKEVSNGRLFPSCSLKVKDGMNILTDDDEVHAARKMALELLLSEHVGDCEAPCQIACPAHMNIPLMNRLIASGKFEDALKIVRRDIALPGVLGRICPAPCEGACHRKKVDEAVSVCLLKRLVADEVDDWRESIPELTNRKVAVIGAGPAGLAAAYYLRLRGIAVELYDENEKAGGQLNAAVGQGILPEEVLEREVQIILDTGVVFRGNRKIDVPGFSNLRERFDAVVLACGANPDFWKQLDIQSNEKGILTDKASYQTSDPKVFAIGNAVRTSKLAVRAVGQGKEVAFSVFDFLNGSKPLGEPRMFNSRLGRLMTEEFADYLKETAGRERVVAEGGFKQGFNPKEAMAEAARCMHCDCRSLDDCKLRIYSTRYQASQKRFSPEKRKPVLKINTHSSLIFEPGKCIKCGICVRLTSKYREELGLTYIGRGFDVQIGVPFSESLEKALQSTANKVAEACPTAALTLK